VGLGLLNLRGFKRFSKRIGGQEWPAGTPTERIAWDIAAVLDRDTQPGHGEFIDFAATSELRGPVIGLLTKGFGWIQEQPLFLRKPGPEEDCSDNRYDPAGSTS